jgi:cell division protein FtsL
VSIDLDALVQTMRITAGHMAPVVLMPHEALALVAEVERLRVERAEWARLLVEAKKEGARSTVAERATERTAVVAWLGAEVDAAMEMHLPVRAATFLECGEAIERGAHRREEKK